MSRAMRILPAVGILAAALALGTAITDGGHAPVLRADTATTTTTPTPTASPTPGTDGFSWG